MYGLNIQSNEQVYIESIKYYSGTYWQQVEDTSIKECFDTARFVVFAVNPTDLFTFWEYDKRFDGKLYIRLFDVTNIDNFFEGKFNWYRDIFVSTCCGRYRINGLILSANFVLQLGYFIGNKFVRLLQSNFVKMPNNAISTNTNIKMATKIFDKFEKKEVKIEEITHFAFADYKEPSQASMGVM
ncbi:MAG TPA: DUF4912 domain-containing protein [Desulfurella acetivorans]|uniref:DUF4912 domain-containing protein n=1 Tax=Desulfurella acetivorans TaxID=33002 RepID=A0A7C6EAS5_DESAE|nr:DUF4912 domain-containing protein [Desulfurella acetivorans]